MVVTYSYRFLRSRYYRWRHDTTGDPHLDETGQISSQPTKSGKQKKCPTCVKEKSVGRKYRWKILICLLPSFLDTSLDLTIVATALPQIASHFNHLNQLNWIVTALTLTATAFIPVFGQLADTFGRYATMTLSVSIVAIGSVLCAVAPAWPVLLLGRSLQGVGAAGVDNVSMIILADRVTLKEQAINTSVFQLLGGVGYSIGPVIGGYLAGSGWRYVFAMSASLSGVSIITLFFIRNDLVPGNFSLRKSLGSNGTSKDLLSGLSTLDLGGIILFIFGVGLVILGTAWGGSTYPWSSAAVVAPIVLGTVTLICFILWEALLSPSRFLNRRFPKMLPMIPSSILSKKDVNLVCLIEAGSGAGLFSVFYFIGIYFSVVEGYEPSRAGLQLMYYIPGLGAGVYGTIFLCNVWPRHTFWPLSVGTLIELVGLSVLAYAVRVRNTTLVNVMMAIAGVGTGMRFMPSNLHLAGMFRDRIAAVYSLLRFTLPFGGTIAMTIMGAVYQNQMSEYFGPGNVNTGSMMNMQDNASLDAISNLSPEEQEAVRNQGSIATMWAFISILPIVGVTLISSISLGNVWISSRKKETADGDEAKPPHPDGLCARHANGEDVEESVSTSSAVDILEGSYLLALFRGDVHRLRKKGPEEPQKQRVRQQPAGQENRTEKNGNNSLPTEETQKQTVNR